MVWLIFYVSDMNHTTYDHATGEIKTFGGRGDLSAAKGSNVFLVVLLKPFTNVFRFCTGDTEVLGEFFRRGQLQCLT